MSKQENVGQYQADTYRSVFLFWLCSPPWGYKPSVCSHSSKLIRYVELDAWDPPTRLVYWEANNKMKDASKTLEVTEDLCR